METNFRHLNTFSSSLVILQVKQVELVASILNKKAASFDLKIFLKTSQKDFITINASNRYCVEPSTTVTGC